MRLDVYNATNTTKLGELTKAHDIAWFTDLREPGSLQFTVDTVDTADLALLDFLRVIRVNHNSVDLEAFVIRNTAAELAVEDERPFTTVQCQGLLSVLGYQAGGAVLWPYGGLDGAQQSPRWFGPMGFDHMDPGTGVEPTTDGVVTREDWPENPTRTERVVFASTITMRRELTGTPALAGPAIMFFTTAWWTQASVWLDGAEVSGLRTEVGETRTRTVEIPYDGEDHVVCIIAEGEPPVGSQNSLAWMWAQAEIDTSGNVTLGSRIFSTYNSTTYTGPTAPTLPNWESWATPPGVTVGFVMKTAVDEAQTLGLLSGVTYDFTAANDSAPTAWAHKFVRSFRMQKLGTLLEALAPFDCEPQMTPTGQLRLWQQRGTDRTATITIDTPFSLSVATQGPQAGEGPYETPDGIGRVVNAAFVTRWGVRLEDLITLGEDLGPDTVLDAVERYILEHSSERPELDVVLPDDIEPYSDVFLGDIVRGRVVAGGSLEDVRVVSLRCDVDDVGHVNWGAVLERPGA
jgi:hypothetical protein